MFSKVIGFAGADGQGVVGLETTYDEILRGTPGRIYTVCDGRGVEVKGYKERREAPKKRRHTCHYTRHKYTKYVRKMQ